jgi:hypothetical protein
MRRPAPAPAAKINWPRADPAELARFDPSTKLCTMNCGPSSLDPRSAAERQLLCGDCLMSWELEAGQAGALR